MYWILYDDREDASVWRTDSYFPTLKEAEARKSELLRNNPLWGVKLALEPADEAQVSLLKAAAVLQESTAEEADEVYNRLSMAKIGTPIGSQVRRALFHLEDWAAFTAFDAKNLVTKE